MKDTFVVRNRFVGPPGMGNGGYVSGMLAQRLSNFAQVTLRQPIPLEHALRVERTTHDSVSLHHGDALLAEAQTAQLEFDVPAPPPYAEVLAAQQQQEYGREHPFPNCFVCGPHRNHGDGLQIYPVLMQTTSMVAATWQPDVSLGDDTGRIQPEFLWAALDCPGGIAAIADRPRPIVLGRITGRVLPIVHAYDRCIVIGWQIGAEGRKHTVGTAIFTETGQLVGQALAIWFELAKAGSA